jgi:ferredoxin-NADP reductase
MRCARRWGVGSELTIIGPRNRFELVPAQQYVFVVGGIGITPLLPMIESVAAAGLPWRLFYGGRSRASMAFLDRLARWHGHVEVVPEDELGRIDVGALLASSVGSAVYACGPVGLTDAVRSVAERWPSGSFHFERFNGGDPAPATVHDAPFEVQLGLGGPVVTVAPGVSVLHAVLDAGADVLYSCEEGSCGSCETTVLEGEVAHRDSLLSEGERASGAMLICVSRAGCPRLVLDIESPS